MLVALLVILLAGCPNKAPWTPSPPVAFGARVTDGRLQLWTGSRCVGVTRVNVDFEPRRAKTVLVSRSPEGVEVDRLALGGPYPPGLTVAQPLPPGFDWRTEETVHFGTTRGSSRWGTTTRLAEVIKGSPEHPADVAAKDGKTFLGLCTRDPVKKPATTI